MFASSHLLIEYSYQPMQYNSRKSKMETTMNSISKLNTTDLQKSKWGMCKHPPNPKCLVGEYMSSTSSIHNYRVKYGKSQDSGRKSLSKKRIQTAIRRTTKERLGKTQVVSRLFNSYRMNYITIMEITLSSKKVSRSWIWEGLSHLPDFQLVSRKTSTMRSKLLMMNSQLCNEQQLDAQNHDHCDQSNEHQLCQQHKE